jgi:fructokinase
MPLYGGIEAGGTKMVCAVGTGPGDLREVRFPTASAIETIPRAIAFFREAQAQQPLEAIGIASFGPIDPDPASPTYGYVTTTPKPGWANVDFAGEIGRVLGVPVAFDTDVNVAAYGEWRWGAARGLHTCVYLTIGTGIGGGALSNGKLLHGLLHPEMGHMRVPHDLNRDPYPGACGYHGDCWEGLASGPAIEGRWKQSGRVLPEGHPAWALEAHYLALGLANITLIACPQRIIMGGGVMEHLFLFPMIRKELQLILNGYVRVPHVAERIDEFVVPPALGNRSGVLGAVALAEQIAH